MEALDFLCAGTQFAVIDNVTTKRQVNVYPVTPIALVKAAHAAAYALRRCAMTYIFDMAGGTEYQGEELSCPHPLETRKQGAHLEYQVELRLAEVETTPSPSRSVNPACVDLSALIGAIED